MIQTKTIITIDRTVPFEPHPFLTTEYGEMTVIWQHPQAEKITSFDIENDVLLMDLAGNQLISAVELRERLRKYEYVPLDAHSAQAICKDEQFLETLIDKWGFHQPRLDTINFLGTFLTDGSEYSQCPEHIISIEFEYYDRNRYVWKPFEVNDEGWGEHDSIAVFNPRSTHIRQQLGQ